ncbi:MAG: hypothetical protein IJS14_02255 [Lentisphaeria bacterium]|nr:hypothetical protein [Lentisphaeria bacterium]
MQEGNSKLSHAEEIAAEVWRKMGNTNLADRAKLGCVPGIRFEHLDSGLNGLAWKDHIELNVDRLEDSDAESFLQEIIRHELAHVAEYRLTGIMGHGPLWHALFLAAGGNGKARDSFPDPYSGAGLGLFMFTAVLESAVLAAWGISALHAPLWCAVAGSFAGFFFPPVCWALCCKDEKSLHFGAGIFTVIETGLLLALISRVF